MDIPGKHAQDDPGDGPADNYGATATPDFSPLYVDGVVPDSATSGMQQFWWLADSVPLGRQLVIAVMAVGLVGVGFLAGRLGQRVIIQQVNVPILAPRADPLPTASAPTGGHGVVLDAGIDNPSMQFDTPAFAEFQTGLPWEESPSYVDPALLAIDNMNKQISVRNYRSMEDYARRSRSTLQHLQRPASETYYVKRRTPAYTRQARIGDRPARFLLPGTPLRLEGRQAQWAQVVGPGGETMWVKAKLLSSDKTYRST